MLFFVCRQLGTHSGANKIIMKKKRLYQTPMLTIVEFRLEKGYAVSAPKLAPEMFIFNDDEDRDKGLNDYGQTDFSW